MSRTTAANINALEMLNVHADGKTIKILCNKSWRKNSN